MEPMILYSRNCFAQPTKVWWAKHEMGLLSWEGSLCDVIMPTYDKYHRDEFFSWYFHLSPDGPTQRAHQILEFPRREPTKVPQNPTKVPQNPTKVPHVSAKQFRLYNNREFVAR